MISGTNLPEPGHAQVIPLTAAQRSIWFAQQLTPDVPYVIAQYVELRGPVDLERLAGASERARRELGGGFIRLVDVDGHPHQLLGTTSVKPVPIVDFRGGSIEAAQAWMRDESAAPIDMYGESLIVSHILHLADEHYYWYSRAHHIALDGYAAMMSMRRAAELYVTAIDGIDAPQRQVIDPERILLEDADYRASPRFGRDRDYWQHQVRELPPVVSLSPQTAAPGATVRVTGDSLPLEPSTRGLAPGTGHNPTALIVAAFAAYLARLTGADDVVLSLPVSARTSARLRAAGGSVSNVLPLRLEGIGATTVGGAIGVARAALTAALRHQRYRREDIGREMGSEGNGLAHFGPVLNLMLFRQEITLGAVTGRVRVLTTGPTADLAVNIYPGLSDSLARIDFEGSPALYDEAELASHHRRFTTFLTSFAAATAADLPVADLDVFAPGEREEFVPASGLPDSDPITLDRLLTAMVESHSEAIAVRDRGRAVSYAELDCRANQVAAALIGQGIGPEDLVAVAAARSYESVLALWSVAKTGAAYVPVDPTHPADRIEYTLGDCGAAVGLTVSTEIGHLPDNVRWLILDDDTATCGDPGPGCAAVADLHRVRSLLIEHPAYVIYTSGSTGRPKGVVVTHQGLANLAQEIRDNYAVSARSRVLHFASPSFDTALVEVLAAAISGATLVVAPPEVYGGQELAALLRDERITHLLSTPSALATVDPTGLDDIQLALVGGEVCPLELVRRWAGGRTMRNAYGPTETTCSVTLTDPITAQHAVTIGSLMRGVSAVVLDHRLRPLPPGAAGELYLATAGVARGYHQRPALTGSRFVANPFGKPGSRLFRTGDRVRWTGERTLKFLGRTDGQVKIRGFRIELGEINAALHRNDDVTFATTVVQQNPAGDPVLVSYIMLRPEAATTPGTLKTEVAQFLPDYMIPASIMVLDAVPLTPTKKLDRGALPAPVFGSSPASRRDPATAAERSVANVFARILAVPAVGADDSFFDLGGDSLSATRVVAVINAEQGTSLGVRELFDTPTVAALAQVVTDAGHPDGERAPRPQLRAVTVPDRVPLSPSQQFIDRTVTTPALFNIPFTVRVVGELDTDALRLATADVLERHRSLRTVFPDSPTGPYQRVLDVADALPDLTPVKIPARDAEEPIARLLETGFDVREQPPLRAGIFALTPREHVLACVIHHIAADGWSLALLARDLVVAYTARAAGAAAVWGPAEVQYSQYSVWRRELLGAESDPESLASRQIAYWKTELAGLPGELPLPTDRPRPHKWSYGAGRESFQIDQRTHRALLTLVHHQHASLFTALRSAVAMLLVRLSGDRDIAIGTPVAGRGDPALDDVVGMFVNTIVLRTRLDPGMSFAEIIDQSRDVELRALAQSEVQFERLVEVLDPPRSSSLHPFFQVALSLNNFTPATLNAETLRFEITPRPLGIAKCDLHFHFTERHDTGGQPAGIDAELVYSTDLFDASTVRSFIDGLQAVLAEITL
ncbi:non-ribosomal peptide synthetase (plasmid) [Rhodococcus jostii RHA1]|uniref:Non-ribosomal peptide synthetase n=2 Tax=Rhodococcus TaxID=1827 RepID=Q0RYP5_RHOJR|nr:MULTISPECIES: non-ribosomal peptide synthetase [Rhodococcus]ABG99591.1 non-ribosomal peptide synthetase [Rhodococcus jostii RHA1]EID79231.1 non-ribosomal peptide synthetase [Rhodococcus opacus RKJ300 = JCM 13270]QQZ18996.1 non-ribosomal peptide synthetase [Rhodococcus sp. 21391]